MLAVWLSGLPDGVAQAVPKGSAATNAVGAGAKALLNRGQDARATRLAARPGPGTNGGRGVAGARPRAGQPGNPVAGTTRQGPGGRITNAPGPGPWAGVKPAPAAQTGPPGAGKGGSRILETWRAWRASPSFFTVLSSSVFGLVLAVLLLVRFIKSRKAALAPAGVPSSMASRMARRKTRTAAVRLCNVLEAGAQGRHLWHFSARGGSFVLNRDQGIAPGAALPAGLIAKDWRALFQRKLNIAWLPPDQVFLRVAQFPASDYTETVAMVELQLEKLSPMPVAQIVWSIYVLPQVHDNQQTVIVMMAARNGVEEFLGQLEGQGFLADRLEMPALDQLQATPITSEGTWIYPSRGEAKHTALAAWWYGGVLQNLDLITLPALNRPEGLKEQLTQIAWAGEMEGWLSATPSWHLVADEAAAAEWAPALRAGLEQLVEISAPLPPLQMAASTATRATQAEAQANLLPVEFATRYQQQFVDRLWMGGLGAVVGLYIIGVAIYFVALEVALIRTGHVEDTVAEVAPLWTNAMQIKARYDVLKTRQDLKYAALDCWKALAELLPESVTLDSYAFSDGKRVSINGIAPIDQQQELFRFDGAMRKYTKDGQPLFDAKTTDNMSIPGHGATRSNVVWNTTFERNAWRPSEDLPR